MLNREKDNLPLDLSYLREMSGDSAEFMIEMIDMFKQQTPIYIADLKAAIADQDWARVSSCAHKIKPTFSYIGREDAKNHMQLIETAAKEATNTEQIPGKFEEIEEFIESLYKQLDQAKSSLQERL